MFSSLLAILLLVCLSAAFSGSETAIFTIDAIRLRTLAEKKVAGAILIEKLRSNPKLLLGTLLICNNAVNVGLSALATLVAIDAFGNAYVGAATGVITLLLVVFGEYMPKSYAAHHNEKFAFVVARPIYALTIILKPLVRVVESIVRIFTRMDEAPLVHKVSEEEIKTMAKLGVKAGTLEHGERELIERVFQFNDITAFDVMTPSEDVEYLDGRQPLADALPVMNRTKFSRFPVHEGDEQKVVGILHIKDVLEAMAEQPDSFKSLRIKDVASTPMFVPETRLIDDIFRDFQRQRSHMAIVINEFGSAVGLVTVDDLLAELVGEIVDESDVDEHVIKRLDRQTIVVHGDAEVRAINRFINVRIPGPSGKTLSRVILEKAGDIPQAGQQITIAENVVATVESVANLRIQRVRVRKTEPEQLTAL